MIEQEQLQLRRRIRQLKFERKRIVLEVIAGAGGAVLVGAGITVLASVPGAAVICFGVATGNPVLAVCGAGLGIISSASCLTAVGVLTYEVLSKRVQRVRELDQEIRRLQSRLHRTPKERLSNIRDELQELLDLIHEFKQQLDSMRSDWSQLSDHIKRTVEHLKKAETSTVIPLIQAKLLAAEEAWQKANEWAKKIHGGCEESTGQAISNGSDLASTLRSACHDFIAIA